MIEVGINPETLNRALRRDIEAGPAYRGASIAGGKGRFYGFLGEEIVKQAMPELILDNTKDYDFIWRNFTFDVKTKTRKEPPKSWFDATVDKSAKHQLPDFYIFVQILAPPNLIKQSIQEIRSFHYQKAWILGFMPRGQFYQTARFFNQGDVDPSNGIKYRDSIYLVRCEQLLDPVPLIDSLKKFGSGLIR